MSRQLLTLSQDVADAALRARDFDEVFLWSSTGHTTFIGIRDPYLSGLGNINARNIDLVRIALGVLAADRSVRRRGGGSDWNARNFDLTVEVGDPAIWTKQAEYLAQIVGFLSGDQWTFRFTEASVSAQVGLPFNEEPRDRTVLLSGGADSAAGALLSAAELGTGTTQSLVSHFSSTATAPVQKNVAKAIAEILPNVQQVHHQVHLNRGSRRLDNSLFRSETTTRSRSLLFLALGLAVGERANSPLWIPENGFASLNPPLGPDRRGSLSTRTTHPRFLHELSDLMTKVGGNGRLENPFERITKGDMFRRVAGAIGVVEASAYLSRTNSCAHTDGRYSGAPVGASCGVCFGCLVRRAAFIAAGIPDQTAYLSGDTSGRFEILVRQKSIIDPLRDFVDRGVLPRDVMTMSLPDNYAAGDALALARRGVEELRGVL